MDRIGTYGGPLVFAGIIGLVTGIVVVAFVNSMRLYGMIDIIIGAVLLGVVGAVFFSNVLAAFVSRTGRYGINTLILIAAFTGIIMVVSVIVAFKAAAKIFRVGILMTGKPPKFKEIIGWLRAK